MEHQVHKFSTEEIAEWLTQKMASELAISIHQVHPDTPFADYGLNSMAALNITGEMEEWIGTDISATLLWDYPTITSLSEYLSKIEVSFA